MKGLRADLAAGVFKHLAFQIQQAEVLVIFSMEYEGLNKGWRSKFPVALDELVLPGQGLQACFAKQLGIGLLEQCTFLIYLIIKGNFYGIFPQKKRNYRKKAPLLIYKKTKGAFYYKLKT